jgi:hypothetical protein
VNDRLDTTITLLYTLHLVGTVLAIIVNCVVASQVLGWRRWLHAGIAGLAFFYGTAYAWILAAGPWVVGPQWVYLFMGVSVLIWPIVWCGPALAILHQIHLAKKKVKEQVRDIMKEG